MNPTLKGAETGYNKRPSQNTTRDSALEAEAQLIDTFKAVLEQWSTSRLQDKNAYIRGTILEDFPSTAADLKTSVIQARMGRQKIYKNQLRRIAQEYKTTFAGSSTDLEYEKWLNAGDPLHKVPLDRRTTWIGSTRVTTVRQPLLRPSRPRDTRGDDGGIPDGQKTQSWSKNTRLNDPSTHYFPESAYELDLSSTGWSTGAVLLENQSLTLRWMCELGDHLQIDPAFFVEHFCRPHRLVVDRIFPLPQGYWGRWTGDMRDYCYLDGAFVRNHLGYSNICVRDTAGFTGVSKMDLDKSHVRVSCMKVDTANPAVARRSSDTMSEQRDAFFVVLMRNAHRHLPKPPSPSNYEIPAAHLFTQYIEDFFSDAWNLQRLSDFMHIIGPHPVIRGIFAWLLSVSAAVKRIEILASQFRALDYELLDHSAIDALSRMKDYRSTVGGLRRSLEISHRVGSNRLVKDAYEVLQDVKTTRDERVGNYTIDKPFVLTARQIASVTIEDEHRWIDQEAASILPLLKQSLKLIQLQHSIEQIEQRAVEKAAANKLSEQSIELSRRFDEVADTMKKDLGNSMQNNERSTVLILLAAVYLLLIIAATRPNGGERGLNYGLGRWSVMSAGFILACLTLLLVFILFTRNRMVQHPWEHKLHKLTGNWWGIVEDDKEGSKRN